MKTFINKICCDEYGHLVLLTVFDAVDDTTLVENSIIKVTIIITRFDLLSDCMSTYLMGTIDLIIRKLERISNR